VFGLFTIDSLTATSGFRRELGKTLFFLYFLVVLLSSSIDKGYLQQLERKPKANKKMHSTRLGLLLGFAIKKEKGQR
jgi:hypothetical protein